MGVRGLMSCNAICGVGCFAENLILAYTRSACDADGRMGRESWHLECGEYYECCVGVGVVLVMSE